MNAELKNMLIKETTIKDIADRYIPYAEIIGVEKFIAISDYAKGEELYFPKSENILAPARNRRIKREFRENGNIKALAVKYDLTTTQIGNILKDEPVYGQLNMFDLV